MSVRDAGKGEGFNARTLQRALKRLGGRAESVEGSFPRRNVYTLPDKKGKSPLTALIDSDDTQTRPLSTSLEVVVSVVSDANRDDRHDSGDGNGAREPLSRPADATDDDGGSALPAVAEPAPPWTVEPVATDAPLPCPCGRPESHHSKGCWRICKASHRWHAFGAHALEACPHCPAADDGPIGGDAA
jgi:hypothetical protein